MIRIFPECCPKIVVNRTIGPYLILRKLGSNSYLIGLSLNMSISPVFNIVDLFPYRGTFESLVLSSSISAGTFSILVPYAPFYTLEAPDAFLDVLDDDFVALNSGGYCRFLVSWKDCPTIKDTQITEEEFCGLRS